MFEAEEKNLNEYYYGRPWDIGLKEIPAEDLRTGLELRIPPLPNDGPIFFTAGARPRPGPGGQALTLQGIRIAPVYGALAA